MTKQAQFEQDIKDDLLAVEQATGAPEIFRLAQARNMAMAQSKRKMPKILWPTLGASFASLLLAGVLLNGQTASNMGGSGLKSSLDGSLDSSLDRPLNSSLANEAIGDEILFLYEDLELDYWLADTDLEGAS